MVILSNIAFSPVLCTRVGLQILILMESIYWSGLLWKGAQHRRTPERENSLVLFCESIDCTKVVFLGVAAVCSRKVLVNSNKILDLGGDDDNCTEPT